MTDRDASAPRPTPPRLWPHEVRHPVTSEELISIAGIAELTGTKVGTVTSWRTRFGEEFPAVVDNPDREHHRVLYFNKAEVLEFLEKHQLGKEFAEGGEVRRGRPSAGDGVFYRTTANASRPSRPSSSRPSGSGPRVRSAADFAPRFDAIATIGLASPHDLRAQDLIADLSMIARSADRTRPTPADALALNDILVRLGAHIADHAPQHRDLVWRGISEHDVLDVDLRAFADHHFIRWVSRLGRGEMTSALEEFESLASRFRRSPSPWSHRPLDAPSVITEALWQLTPSKPLRLLDLTCGIGSAAIPALRDGVDVIGCDREAADIRVARQWSALVELHAKPGHHATARFERRDRLTDFETPRADLVLLSDPSADSEELGRTAGTRYWLGTQLRVDTALGHTSGTDGRMMLVLPTHMLDPNTEADIGTDAQMLARETRTGWADRLEAVIEMPTSRLPLNTSILIFHGDHGRPHGPILFATMPSEFRELRELTDALASLRNDAPDIERLQRHIGGRAAHVPREDVANSNGNLTPANWWRAEFVKNPERVDEVLRTDRNRITSSISKVHQAIREFERIGVRVKEPDGEPIVWRPFTELADEGLITPITPAPAAARMFNAVRDGREPIYYPGRAMTIGPFAADEAHFEIDRRHGSGELTHGDVVYWFGRDVPIFVRVHSSSDLSVLFNPGRGIRVTGEGRDAGLTPDLLAFAIEASGSSVERAASRRSFDTLRFPARDDEQSIRHAVAWFGRRFTEVAVITEVLRSLEAKAIELSTSASEMRRDVGVFGGTATIDTQRVRTPFSSERER
jgi:hypothetical protein